MSIYGQNAQYSYTTLCKLGSPLNHKMKYDKKEKWRRENITCMFKEEETYQTMLLLPHKQNLASILAFHV